MAFEVSSVPLSDHAGIAAQFSDPIQLASDTQAGERGVHHQAEAFPW
jgi:hypothetical protein